MQIVKKTKHLTVFRSILFQTNCTLIEMEGFVLLVDPCWLHDEFTFIRLHIDIILNGRAFYLLFTHSDYDHILAYHLFKDATVICSEAFENHPDKEGRVEETRQFCEHYYLDERYYAQEYPKGDIIAKDGDSLKLGEMTLHFYTAPGHTEDSLFTFVEPLGIWIAGDYLSPFEFPFIYHSPLAYEETMKKARKLVAKHQPKIAIPGHGSLAESSDEMLKRITKDQAYLKDLKAHVVDGKPFDLAACIASYRFPKSLTVEHEKNLVVAKAEFGK